VIWKAKRRRVGISEAMPLAFMEEARAFDGSLTPLLFA
jgi:hypothetical protein